MRPRFVTLLFSAWLVPAALAQTTLAAFAEAKAAECMTATLAPGVSVAIGVKGKVVFARGFGKADVENDVPATESTVYRLASISKPVTAVAVMMLRDQGLLDLDADVRKYVPAFPEKQWTVTPRLLLGHLAGVRHYKEGEAESTTHFATASDGLARFANDALLHEPGTKYLYSTYGFNLLGIAVEKVSGQTFASFVRDQIAAPAGADSLRDDDVQAIIAHRAQGYVKQGTELMNAQLMDPSYKLGGGGLCCNAPDLVRFAMALMDGRLLCKESVAELWTAQKTRDGKATSYGLGFGVASRDGRRVVSHTGAQARVSTALCLLPDQSVAVAVLCNLEHVAVGAMAQAIAAEAAAGTDR